MIRMHAARCAAHAGARLHRWLPLLVALAPWSVRADVVTVPGGTAAIRRLVGLEAGSDAGFFLDVHTALLAEADPRASWERIPRRKLVHDFLLDLAEWRKQQGDSVALSAADPEARKRLKRALTWLGYEVRLDGTSFHAEPKDDVASARRQLFLEALGLSTPAVLRRLQAGQTLTVTVADGAVPIPFGLGAWRETLNDPSLGAENAFLALLENVPASRFLVALQALDAPTRDRLRALGDWRVLYERCLDGFARFPEALTLEGDAFALPGGAEADAVWTEVFRLPPRTEHATFLEALYARDQGKAAYVVDVLQQLPPATSRAILLGGSSESARPGPLAGRGVQASKSSDRLARAKTLLRAIEQAGSHAREKREPYDFAHVARFLRFDDQGALVLPGGPRAFQAAISGTGFPADEAQLQALLSGEQETPTAEEVLAEILRRSDVGRFTPQRRLLIVQGLCDARPALADPGTVVLLFRGADRLLSAYATLAELPLEEPALARRLLFACDRLDRASGSRAGEVAAGSFQSALALLALLERSSALAPPEIRALLSELLDRAGGSTSDWTAQRLLPALRARERAAVEEKRRRDEAYRAALEARNARIEARRGAERDRLEGARAEAELRVSGLLEPLCPPDDTLPGPWPPRYVVEREWLARGAPASPELPADSLAQVWINDALAVERSRARPLAASLALVRVPGALPGTSAVVDPEPLPEYVRSADVLESHSADELLTRALVGNPPAAAFDWRGARYRFDLGADERARRTLFREKQRLPSLDSVEDAAARLPELRAARERHDDAATRDLVSRLQRALENPGAEDEERRATAASTGLDELQQQLDERNLETLLGHLYAAHAVDPEDLFFADTGLVRRHSFRREEETGGRVLRSAFGDTALTRVGAGGGSRITGSVFGLPEVLSLLHAEQLSYRPDAIVPTDDVKTSLVVGVRRISPLWLDDAALALLLSSCRAAEELVAALPGKDPLERLAALRGLASDLVPRRRLGAVAEDPAAAAMLSPSDLYRIGRRRVPAQPALREALRAFGPRTAAWNGLQRLDDVDLPPYERLAAYRSPQLFCDRLYDPKIAVARRLAEAGLPAALLPLVLTPAVDEMLARLKMAYAFDWETVVRAAQAFSAADLDRLLDAARETGRLAREDALDVVREIP